MRWSRSRFLCLICFTLALIAPSTNALSLTLEEARHLLGRAGFTARPAEIDTYRTLDIQSAVERLLASHRGEPALALPDWIEDWRPPRKGQRSKSEKEALRKKLRGQALSMKAWWMAEMIQTPAPLTEVMTLFWHNHFTSGLRKVKAPALLWRQNLLLRRHAIGNFGELLRAMARDPAMLLYLDNARSRAAAPNENFARELLELFTLGEGHYGEADIKEVARAFTGWSLDRQSGTFMKRPRWHDDGLKRILGRRGRFDGDDVIDILLDHPATARHVVTKLWLSFVSETPDPDEVMRLAALFRQADYEIKPLLAALFVSDHFWARENRARLVKSPVDLIVGTLRLFDIAPPKTERLAMITRRLGQDLFDPPNVKGWPGGTAWITSDTLLLRQQIMARLTGAWHGDDEAPKRGAKMAAAFGRQIDRWAAGQTGAWQTASAITVLLLPSAPVDTEVLDPQTTAALVRQLLRDPVYQLK